MTYLISALFAGFVVAVTLALAQLGPSRPAIVAKRLEELAELGSNNPFDTARRRQRQATRQKLEGILQALGQRSEGRQAGETRAQLVQAGFRSATAARLYAGLRIALPLGLIVASLLLTPFLGQTAILMGFGLALVGWIGPAFYVGSRVKRRHKELQKALPDALDSMVVCVEAGLGLNQAMVRVSEEIRHISTLMSDELVLTNLEIRAGTPREDALRHLAERTGLADLRSLVTMLIQTDRFGTSIAQALRVQSDTLREKRKQRAEEAAAKTAIKMLFPLIFLIFPAMFVITLGPAVIKLIEGWGNAPI